MPIDNVTRREAQKARRQAQQARRQANQQQNPQGTPQRLYGRTAPIHDPRTFRFENYCNLLKLPTPPSMCDWTTKVTTWPMMINNTLGDCTIAAAGHLIELWTTDESGTGIIVPDDQILTAYEAVSGYKPGKPKTDNGAAILTVLKYWQKTGIGGHKIQAYASLELQNATLLQTAIYAFGGVDFGISMPLSAQGQRVWSVPTTGTKGRGKPGSWGGHSVPVVAYSTGGLTVVSWGQLYQMTWQFYNTYCDEAYVILSPDWIAKNNTTPSGFDLAALQADLKAL